eukprot:CAMPEP_0168317124 /NCGR_PEP_ID=MMETSP0210-20121227/22716_1 /TAXON_ID=40633 /ORGANISM="Condylostoma magnum, Strain COL2" /LENGTH=34 /DNA_ID= /DNA_START= /DNA_END= /DNA_ORIENTATION=
MTLNGENNLNEKLSIEELLEYDSEEKLKKFTGEI